MKKLLGVPLAALVAFAPVGATTIDFSALPTGPVASPIVYPEATFTSSTGTFYVGAAGLAHEICPLTPAFNCEATVSVAFTDPVNDLTFETSGYDSAATVFISGVASGGAFSTSFATSGAFTYPIDLSAWTGITSLIISNDDPAGLAYNYFTFNGAVPEPASWALMIIGFGATGASLRIRKRTIAAA